MTEQVVDSEWSCAVQTIEQTMQQVSMYQAATRDHDEPCCPDAKPGVLQVRRMRYSAGNTLRLTFSIHENGSIHASGVFSDTSDRRNPLHEYEFTPANLTAASLRLHMLEPFHSAVLKAVRRPWQQANPGDNLHGILSALVQAPGGVFRYEESTSESNNITIANPCLVILSLAYGNLGMSVWRTPDPDRRHKVGGALLKEYEMLQTVLELPSTKGARVLAHLLSNPEWWPWFSEFDQLNKHLSVFATIRAGNPESEAARIDLLGMLLHATLYRIVSTWGDTILRRLQSSISTWDDLAKEEYPESWDTVLDEAQDLVAAETEPAQNDMAGVGDEAF